MSYDDCSNGAECMPWGESGGDRASDEQHLEPSFQSVSCADGPLTFDRKEPHFKQPLSDPYDMPSAYRDGGSTVRDESSSLVSPINSKFTSSADCPSCQGRHRAHTCSMAGKRGRRPGTLNKSTIRKRAEAADAAVKTKKQACEVSSSAEVSPSNSAPTLSLFEMVVGNEPPIPKLSSWPLQPFDLDPSVWGSSPLRVSAESEETKPSSETPPQTAPEQTLADLVPLHSTSERARGDHANTSEALMSILWQDTDAANLFTL